MAFRWWTDDGRLGSFVIFQGIRTSIAKKPYIFYVSGGSGHPAPPLDPPMDLLPICAHIGFGMQYLRIFGEEIVALLGEMNNKWV